MNINNAMNYRAKSFNKINGSILKKTIIKDNEINESLRQKKTKNESISNENQLFKKRKNNKNESIIKNPFKKIINNQNPIIKKNNILNKNLILSNKKASTIKIRIKNNDKNSIKKLNNSLNKNNYYKNLKGGVLNKKQVFNKKTIFNYFNNLRVLDLFLNKKIMVVLLSLLLISMPVFALKQLLTLQGKVDINGVLVDNGNLTVQIWDSPSGGSLLYVDYFNNSIQDGFFDVILGNGTVLDINLSQTYYLDLQVNNTDLDFDGNERRIFQSPVGFKLSGFENFTVDTNVLFVDTENDRVGIGTASPSSSLEVSGDIELTNLLDTDGTSFFDLTGCGTSATFTALDSTGAVTCSSISITESQISDLSHSTTEDFIANLSVANDSISLWNISGKDIFPKHIEGNVGIGTTSPQNKLEVIGAVTLAGGVNASSLNVTGFSITDDSLVTVVEFDKENKKSLNQVETIRPEIIYNNNKYLNVSFSSEDDATVAQLGRASALGADVRPDVRVQNLNSDESPGSGVSQSYNKDFSIKTRENETFSVILEIEDFRFPENLKDFRGSQKSEGFLRKVKIKDVKAGDYVLSLDESTGKLVPRRVNALLDHGIKLIYEMTTEDGRAINTTAEHPYLAKLYSKEECDKYAGNLWNKEPDSFNGEYCTRWVEVKDLKEGIKIAVPRIKDDYPPSLDFLSSLNNSPVLNTLTTSCFLNSFSSDQIGQLSDNAKAKYGTSLVFGGTSLACGASSMALDKNLLCSSFGTDSIIFSSNEKNMINSNPLIPEYFCILPLSFANSSNTKSAEINLNPSFGDAWIRSLLAEEGLKNENNILASTTKNIYINPYLFATLPFSSLPSFIANSSVILLFFNTSSAYLNNNAVVDLSLNALETIPLNSSLLISLATTSKSSGISTFSSAISSSPMGNNENDYLNVAKSDVIWAKIKSIKTLPAQHVYDLSIEGTRNFIANDIVAHNTYLATSSGNVGIGTTSPAHKLHVIGNINATGSINATVIEGGSIFQNGKKVNDSVIIGTHPVGGEVSGTINSITLSNTALDDQYMRLGTFNLGNISNNTLVKGDNATLSLWNKIGANDASFRLSGSVGIGTTSPATTLDVKGKANFTGNFSIGQTSNIFFVDNTSGKVGFGTTNTDIAGTVLDTVVVGWANPSVQYGVIVDKREAGGARLGFANEGTYAAGMIFQSDERLDIDTGGTNARITILEGGNVGIGTTSPAQTLTVQGRVNISQNLTVNNSVLFVDGTSGRVGIGTTSPTSLLHLYSTTAEADKITLQDASTAGQARGGVIYGGYGANGLVLNTLAGDGATWIRYGSTDGYVAYHQFYSNGVEAMRIHNNGNVGIGTTSPNYLLQVASGTDGRSVNLSNVLYVNGSSGNVGIGTTSPQSLLSLTKGTNQDADLLDFIDGGTSLFQFYGRFSGTGTTGNWLTLTDWSSNNIMTWRGDGNVGIGNTAPNNTLDVSGNTNLTKKIFAPGLTSSTGGSSVCVVNGELINSGSATDCSASSLRFKENIAELEYGLDIVMKMNPVSFNFKEGINNDESRRVGLIAEEVEKIDKRLVNYDVEGLPASIRYNEYTAILTKAIQKQQAQIEDLKKQVEELKEERQ